MLMCYQNTMYSVVYGPEWEDISYYTSIHKATHRLLVMTKGYGGASVPTFYPFMRQYGKGVDGELTCTQEFVVSRKKLSRMLKYLTIEDLSKNPADILENPQESS
jgi:hypothetical protein